MAALRPVAVRGRAYPGVVGAAAVLVFAAACDGRRHPVRARAWDPSGPAEVPDAGPDAADPPDATPPPPGSCPDTVFRLDDAAASTVWVTGSFTGWAATPEDGALPLEAVSPGRFARSVALPAGWHSYKFILDGSRWVEDPLNPERRADGFGGVESAVLACDTVCGPDEGWSDRVLYFALVDRFFDSDGYSEPVDGATGGDPSTGPSAQYEGGDLAGVTAKLPYLTDLGVTALWLSAPYENRDRPGEAANPAADPNRYSAYHGYWPSPAAIDYADPGRPTPTPRVESRIGSEADLRALVEAAHGAETASTAGGMKVLFDYVMKHVDVESGLAVAHPDWFSRRGDGRFALCGPENLWSDPYWTTRCAFAPYLAPFDFERDEVRAWSVRDAVWWAQAFGIDGYRLDAIKHVPLPWLTELREALAASIEDESFLLIGETYDFDDRELLRGFVDPARMLDGQFDFPLRARLCDALFSQRMGLGDLASWLDDNDGFYGAGTTMVGWIGNHDGPRAIHFASRELADCRLGSTPENGWAPWSFGQPVDAAPYERLALAFTVLFTRPGVPLVYYGDEIGLAGGGDPDNRRMMRFEDAELLPSQRWLRETVRALARLRAARPVLARGERETLEATADVWVYRMTGCAPEADTVVALNRADDWREVHVPGGAWVDVLGGERLAGGSRWLGPRSFLVLGVADEEGTP